jgi:hypothetical protein
MERGKEKREGRGRMERKEREIEMEGRRKYLKGL